MNHHKHEDGLHRQQGARSAVELVAGGMSRTAAYQQVADEYGVTPRTVRTWIKNTGVEIPDVAYPAAFRDFNEARRSEALHQIAELVEGRTAQLKADLEAGISVPSREIRELAVAFGVLTDKQRLEDGDVTDRTEQTMVPAREILEAKIEDLAERRKNRKLKIVEDDKADRREKQSPPDLVDRPKG